jgi:hypothetical protein
MATCARLQAILPVPPFLQRAVNKNFCCTDREISAQIIVQGRLTATWGLEVAEHRAQKRRSHFLQAQANLAHPCRMSECVSHATHTDFMLIA